jgi:hypothetical protein
MSRSWKKVPGFTDSERSGAKAYYLRLMNRRIRRLDLEDDHGWIPDGNLYRRFVERWGYRDYNFRYYSERELEYWHGAGERSYRVRRK